jgi:hypothetical protein
MQLAREGAEAAQGRAGRPSPRAGLPHLAAGWLMSPHGVSLGLLESLSAFMTWRLGRLLWFLPLEGGSILYYAA